METKTLQKKSNEAMLSFIQQWYPSTISFAWGLTSGATVEFSETPDNAILFDIQQIILSDNSREWV